MNNRILYPVTETETLREETLSASVSNITDSECENTFFVPNNVVEKICELELTQSTYPLILYTLFSATLCCIFTYVIIKLLKGDRKRKDKGEAVLVHKISARACWSGNIRLVKYMLQNGADITLVTSTKDTPIYLASYRAIKNPDNWNPALLDLLYRAGFSVNTFNANGHTPLILAAKAGHVTLARWLLIHGADPNLHGSVSPYQLAVSYGDSSHQSIAALLHLHITMSNRIDYSFNRM